MSIIHFDPESHCFFCQQSSRQKGYCLKLYSGTSLIVIEKKQKSGTLFFPNVFLFCCQSFVTGAITLFVKIYHLCQSDKTWQMKKKNVVDSCLFLLSTAIHFSHFSFQNELEQEGKSRFILKATLCPLFLWKIISFSRFR